MFQYLGSRGAQPAVIGSIDHLTNCFNTWAREEPNPDGGNIGTMHHVSILGLARSPTIFLSHISTGHTGFNTWAREEPNMVQTVTYLTQIVSILGLARSPTVSHFFLAILRMFQYLGSRGAQRRSGRASYGVIRFQYLGSRGAQRNDTLPNAPDSRFNTWAREEPNPMLLEKSFEFFCFNTWAREEPNYAASMRAKLRSPVSILGLARSPTTRR